MVRQQRREKVAIWSAASSKQTAFKHWMAVVRTAIEHHCAVARQYHRQALQSSAWSRWYNFCLTAEAADAMKEGRATKLLAHNLHLQAWTRWRRWQAKRQRGRRNREVATTFLCSPASRSRRHALQRHTMAAWLARCNACFSRRTMDGLARQYYWQRLMISATSSAMKSWKRWADHKQLMRVELDAADVHYVLQCLLKSFRHWSSSVQQRVRHRREHRNRQLANRHRYACLKKTTFCAWTVLVAAQHQRYSMLVLQSTLKWELRLVKAWRELVNRQLTARAAVASLYARKRKLYAGFMGFRMWWQFSFRGLRPALAAAVAAATNLGLPDDAAASSHFDPVEKKSSRPNVRNCQQLNVGRCSTRDSWVAHSVELLNAPVGADISHQTRTKQQDTRQNLAVRQDPLSPDNSIVSKAEQAMLTQSIGHFSGSSTCPSSDDTESCVLFECLNQDGKLMGTASPPARSPSPPRLSQAPVTASCPRLAQAPESLHREMGLKMETSLRHSGTTLLAMAILSEWADVVTAAVFRREMLAQSGVFCRFYTMKRSFCHWQGSLKQLQGDW